MRRAASRILIGLLSAVLGIAAWNAALAIGETESPQEYRSRFEVNKPICSPLLRWQIQQATGLKLVAERPGEETDGGLQMIGVDEPDDPPFHFIREMTVSTYRGPLLADQEAAIRDVIARHQPVTLRAEPPDYAGQVEASLASKGLEGRVFGDPLKGFTFMLQGPLSESQRAAVQEAVSQWGLELQPYGVS